MENQNVTLVKQQTEPTKKMSDATSLAAVTASKPNSERRWQLIKCTHPRKASLIPEELGGGLSFKKDYGTGFIGVPCGKCRVCRKKKSREWGLRIDHESHFYPNRCVFLTLTYKPEALEGTDYGLNYRDIQLFLKRLRKNGKRKFRYFVAGEYGAAKNDPTEGLRPHWHLIIFGHNFTEHNYCPDLNVTYPGRWDYKIIKGRKYWINNHLLTKCWPNGYHSFNDYEPGAGLYVAQYVTKKLGGDSALQKYWRPNRNSDGTIRQRAYIEGWWVNPEMMRCSLGIGKKYYERHESEIRETDSVQSNGISFSVPRYYDKLFEQKHGSQELAKIHKRRVQNALESQNKILDMYDDQWIWEQKKRSEHKIYKFSNPREGNHDD